MHFGTFQPEPIGDYFPLHSLYLSPALYRLTEVVLILLMLPTNRVRRRCNVVQCSHNKGCLFLLFLIVHFPAVIFFIAWTNIASVTTF